MTLTRQKRKSAAVAGLARGMPVPPVKDRGPARFAVAAAQESSPAADTRSPAAKPSQDLALLDVEKGFPLYRERLPVEPGQRWSVPLGLVDDNPLNPRVFYPDEHLQRRAASLRAEGQLTPALVYVSSPPGRFVLKDGHSRKRALELADIDVIKVEVVPVPANVLDDFRQNRIINTERSEQSLLDDAVRFGELIKRGLVRDGKALAALFALSEAEVSKTLRIGQLPRTLLERMAGHPAHFGIATAYTVSQVCKKSGAATALRLVERVVAGRLSSRQVDELSRNLAELEASPDAARPPGQRQRARALSRAELKGDQVGELKAFENGRLTLEIGNLTDERRNLLFGRILTLFSECGLDYQATAAPVPGHDLASS